MQLGRTDNRHYSSDMFPLTLLSNRCASPTGSLLICKLLQSCRTDQYTFFLDTNCICRYIILILMQIISACSKERVLVIASCTVYHPFFPICLKTIIQKIQAGVLECFSRFYVLKRNWEHSVHILGWHNPHYYLTQVTFVWSCLNAPPAQCLVLSCERALSILSTSCSSIEIISQGRESNVAKSGE